MAQPRTDRGKHPLRSPERKHKGALRHTRLPESDITHHVTRDQKNDRSRCQGGKSARHRGRHQQPSRGGTAASDRVLCPRAGYPHFEPLKNCFPRTADCIYPRPRPVPRKNGNRAVLYEHLRLAAARNDIRVPDRGRRR